MVSTDLYVLFRPRSTSLSARPVSRYTAFDRSGWNRRSEIGWSSCGARSPPSHGEPVTFAKQAKALLIPISVNDVSESIMGEGGLTQGTAMSLLAIFGMGVQTYGQAFDIKSPGH